MISSNGSKNDFVDLEFIKSFRLYAGSTMYGNSLYVLLLKRIISCVMCRLGGKLLENFPLKDFLWEIVLLVRVVCMCGYWSE